MLYRNIRIFAFVIIIASALLSSGCRVTSIKDGKNENVNIGTPFGSMQVKTNKNVDSGSLGLSVYPGSMAVKDNGDSESADVNLNFGEFHLGVKASSYQTPDNQNKVISFYRQDMTRYGQVIECHGNKVVGTPERTNEGLTCEESDKNHVTNLSSSELELRAGSPQHQHIVALDAKDGGTRIALIALNLPKELHSSSKKQSE